MHVCSAVLAYAIQFVCYFLGSYLRVAPLVLNLHLFIIIIIIIIIFFFLLITVSQHEIMDLRIFMLCVRIRKCEIFSIYCDCLCQNSWVQLQ